MEVVIFEEENVTIKRKKAQPSPDYSTVGNKDNKVTLIFEDGDVYLKVCNPESGLVYIYSQIRSTTNPDFNLINSRGVHLILLVSSLKPEPSPYIFVFNEKDAASKFHSCVFLAAKAAKADELMHDLYDADTIEGESVSSVESNFDDNFNPTQDFNADAQALAQELLASYK